MELLSRAEAKARGETRYFTGKPCPAGHVTWRWVASYTCDACQRTDQARRYADNRNGRRDKQIATAQKAYFADLEKSRAYQRAQAKLTYEQRKPYQAAWVDAHRQHLNAYRRVRYDTLPFVKEQARANVRNYRARKRDAKGSHTVAEIAALWIKQRERCARCNTKLVRSQRGCHADHIVALSRGGTNDIGNIQLLCGPCNQRKFTKGPAEWLGQREVTLK